jgi:hypothetical protein
MSLLSADTVAFIWAEGGSSSNSNGAGATQAAWEAGSPSDFIGAAGAPIDTASGAAVTESGGGNALITSVGDFANTVTGTIAFITFAATHATGYYIVGSVTNDTIEISGLSHSSPGDDTTADVIVGGSALNASAINGDIGDASTSVGGSARNRTMFIKGDETLGAGLTITNGGTAATLLAIRGVDASWDRITPTRLARSGGSIANGLLDTANMPTFTQAGNALSFNGDYTQVDGIYFTGSVAANLVGTSSADYQSYTNCAFDNSNTGNSAIALRADNFTTVFNCDLIASGATGTTTCFNADAGATVINCLVRNDSSNAASFGISLQTGPIINCLFYDTDGIAVTHETDNALNIRYGNTFENVGVAYVDDTAVVILSTIFNSIAKDCTTFYDNPGVTNRVLISMFNNLNGNTTDYPADVVGDVFNGGSNDLGFQDVTGDPLFVSEANDNYNLQNTSPSKNTGPLKGDRGAMASAESGAGGGAVKLIDGGLIS